MEDWKRYKEAPETDGCDGCAFDRDRNRCEEHIQLCDNCIFVLDEVVVPRALLEEIRDWLSAPQRTPAGMETHRAESEGVDHLLAGVVDALGGS